MLDVFTFSNLHQITLDKLINPQTNQDTHLALAYRAFWKSFMPRTNQSMKKGFQTRQEIGFFLLECYLLAV